MRLDAPVNLYLPDALRVRDDGMAQPVRLANLMNHTPGFEDRALGQLFERDYDRVRPLATYLRQERPHRVREPGTLVSYSNYGAGLAGEAVSEVSGKPFESLVESDILGPLGLTHTTFREPHPVRPGMPAPMSAELAAGAATGYRWTGAGFAAQPYEFVEQVAPAGAASSTAGDMARYMTLLMAGGTLDGVSIYGAPTAQAFATPLPRPAPGVPAWRHGLAESPLSGGFTGVGHGGATMSFLSNLVIVPDLSLGVFVSTNTTSGGGLADTLPDRIVEHFYAGPRGAPAGGSRALVEDRGAFEGAYLSDRRAYHGLEGFLTRLIGAAHVSVTPDGHLLVSDFDGVTRWSAEGAPAAGQFVADDGPSRFVFQMADGRAARFFAPWGGIAYERIGFFGQSSSLALLTSLVAIASIATLIGLFMRLRRDFRETLSQQRASLMQTSQSLLWLMAMLMFGVWAMGAGDIAQVMYGWPGPAIILGSTCALVASVMTVLSLGLVPFVWRGGRRVDSWTVGRKTRFTMTAVIFLAFAVMLGLWGALEPWSG